MDFHSTAENSPRPCRKHKGEKGSKRTFTGCWSCRSRRVKCDERIPSCSQCVKFGKECAGYRQNLVWVESSNHKKYLSGGRRMMELETWQNFQMPDTSKLDDIIARCDFEPEDIDTSYVSCPPFGVFRILDVSPGRTALDTQNRGDIHVSDMAEDITSIEDLLTVETEGSMALTLMPSLRQAARLNDRETHLFGHYIRDVVPGLMPFEDPRNPWSSYPALALHYSNDGRRFLLHALMSLSAADLANNGHDSTNMLATSTQYYVMAIAELRKVISEISTDYVCLLTTIMTLMFTEMCHGRSKTWRPHLNGAWHFMSQQKDHQEWSTSDQAWYATQSFCLIKIMSETCRVSPEDTLMNDQSSQIEDFIVDCLLANNLFGLTLGASSSLMRCIADINRFVRVQGLCTGSLSKSKVAEDILQRLEQCRDSDILPATHGNGDIIERGYILGQLHLRAFIAAAFIYFYQIFYALPPCSLATYVSEVLETLTTFAALGGTNFTLWLAVIAGVEVYLEEDKAALGRLFDRYGGSGGHHRLRVRVLVEEVWRVREIKAAETGLAKDLIRVDWRVVMRDLELDILLV